MSAIRCDDCGRFSRAEGASMADIYDFTPGSMGLDREHFRCARCTEVLGPARSNARPHDGDMSRYEWLL